MLFPDKNIQTVTPSVQVMVLQCQSNDFGFDCFRLEMSEMDLVMNIAVLTVDV